MAGKMFFFFFFSFFDCVEFSIFSSREILSSRSLSIEQRERHRRLSALVFFLSRSVSSSLRSRDLVL